MLSLPLRATASKIAFSSFRCSGSSKPFDISGHKGTRAHEVRSGSDKKRIFSEKRILYYLQCAVSDGAT